ncbi:MAG: YifB family Mg chelatase-like AAA ATPase [Desulfobacteraceae bacterium]|nr:YifB family Mg chelatase-like AAA ATPase [Desulfobacteraceae bacterium]
MIAKVNSCAVCGIDAMVVEVEVDISFGLPVFNMVGLAEIAVRESKERVRTAINNAGYTFPMDRVVINLAPADVKKEGTGLDLPVALGILAASGLIPRETFLPWLIAGELSLDGRIKPIKAVLPYALAARDNGFKGIIVPRENADEAAMVTDIEVLPVSHLSQVVDYFSGFIQIAPHRVDPKKLGSRSDFVISGDFADVRGQAHVKRALEIAAAGSHHVLMTGPPGSGKSMLAQRLAGILPLPAFGESMEIARIYSIMGLVGKNFDLLGVRPFRSPHHTISDAGMVGGGSKPVPGEISLAHHGVLFLDELPEFKKNVLEVLRQPMEDGQVTIARAGVNATYPCSFMLVGAMNPCPCGNFGNPLQECSCARPQIQRYRSKISGPLLDRIDIQIEVPQVSFGEMAGDNPSESSVAIRERVNNARKIQIRRFKKQGLLCNARMGSAYLKKVCLLEADAKVVLHQAMDRLGFSARSFNSILKVARTIADLACEKKICRQHVLEAVQYKNYGRNNVSAF